MLKLLTTSVLLACPLIACAQFLDNPRDSISAFIHKAVTGGELVSSESDMAKATVRLEFISSNDTDKPDSFPCSGTLIARDLVLTAAHCLVDLHNPKNKTLKVAAYLSQEEPIPGASWLLDSEYAEVPDASGERLIEVHDIALVKLEIPVDQSAVIAEIPDEEMTKGSSLDVVLAGFGQTDWKDKNSFGLLRSANVTGVMETMKTASGSDHQIKLSGHQPCNGDSGGPVYQIKGEQLILLGVTSYGLINCSANGHAISVWHHLPWIRDAAKQLRSTSDI